MRAYDLAEVGQLHRFLKDPGAVSRRDILRGWGLCPRHTWAAAVVECELDWRTRAVGTLSRELLSRALQVLTAPGWPQRFRRRLLRDRG